MEFTDKVLTPQEIEKLRQQFGNYLKLTIDLKNKWIVAGGDLYADAEKLRIETRKDCLFWAEKILDQYHLLK